MKLNYLFFSLIIISACQPSVQPTALPADSISMAEDTVAADFHEVITTDLNNDGKIDTLTLSKPAEEGDLGTFQKIEISLNGGDRKSFETNNMWDVVDESFLQENENAVESSHFFVYKDNNHFEILLFGYIYGAGRSDFNIIYGQGTHFKMVFDDAIQTPMKLQDMDLDGKPEFLCRKTDYEITGGAIDSLGPGQVGTYDPFSVFTIKNDTMVLDEAASRRYNEQHYIWLGKEANPTLRVYYFEDENKLPVEVK
ncbi:hypothetical protein [Chitinophaga tropicalis]|uniref:Uncharacterized protein n=1 Tax=Chitinophaga tropicalis TaxID=2683588 RepID=A0A7K1UED9_9BACT|nr:hypothetical protein [Chitinophaga tropicalis]MVT12335.1 hypothetical protein [Chitinophaga tropicalis]